MISDEMVAAMAEAYADAWSHDIALYLGTAAPRWSAMGPGQQAAMLRVGRAALVAVRPLIMEEAAKIAEQETTRYYEGVSAVDVRLSYQRGPRWKDGKDIAAAIRALAAKEPG